MKYRKKPVVIDAFQITKKIYKELINLEEGQDLVSCKSFWDWPKWLQDASEKEVSEKGCFNTRYKDDYQELTEVYINTLEGRHIVSPNDWIIRGVKGELYPCEPDIFKQTYEKMEE